MVDILDRIPDSDPLANTKQLKVIDSIIDEHKETPGSTMVVLNEIQSEIGFISEPMQAYIAKRLQVPQKSVHGVISFYSFFTTQPTGKHVIKFCMGTACYVGGTEQLIDKAKQVLGINPGETTADGEISLEICRCVGACSQAPVIVVDDAVVGRVRPNKMPQIIKELQG
jgi:NADH:ubiquinone oxidoreductase subunit E